MKSTEQCNVKSTKIYCTFLWEVCHKLIVILKGMNPVYQKSTNSKQQHARHIIKTVCYAHYAHLWKLNRLTGIVL